MRTKWVTHIAWLGALGLALYLVMDVLSFVNTVSNWIRYPWSSIQGKSPPKMPPAPAIPVPDYPKASFPVLDSGFLAAEDENYWWLDNERVMFKGYEAGSYDPDWEKQTREERLASGRYDYPLKGGFYIWDTRKNTVSLYRRDVDDFCYEDGEAFFRKVDQDPKKLIYMRGPLGKEKEIPSAKPGDLLNNRPCWPGSLWDDNGRFMLRRDWGTVDMRILTPQQIDDPVLLLPPHGDPVALPIRRTKWDYAFYAPWRDQYLLIDSSSATSKMPEIWWLSRDGRTEAIPIPHTGYRKASFFPVKPGIVMDGNWRPGVRRREEMFLLPNDGPVVSFPRIWPQLGQARRGISPDGCRIAFRGERCEYPPNASFANIVAYTQCFTAQMIDFCQRGDSK